jgi:hypothetical protein
MAARRKRKTDENPHARSDAAPGAMIKSRTRWKKLAQIMKINVRNLGQRKKLR